jgi:hypothetical protein
VTGEPYPEDVESIKDMLARQVASPVQWVKGLQTLYAEGVRTFVEVGPKKALKGFTDDVLGAKPDVVSLFTNHPKTGAIQTFNHALCGLYAAGYGLAAARAIEVRPPATAERAVPAPVLAAAPADRVPVSAPPLPGDVAGGPPVSAQTPAQTPVTPVPLDALAQLLAQALHGAAQPLRLEPDDRNDSPKGSVVVTGAGLGLPGAEKAVMDPSNTARILRGEQFIDLLPQRFRDLADGRLGEQHPAVLPAEGRFDIPRRAAPGVHLQGQVLQLLCAPLQPVLDRDDRGIVDLPNLRDGELDLPLGRPQPRLPVAIPVTGPAVPTVVMVPALQVPRRGLQRLLHDAPQTQPDEFAPGIGRVQPPLQQIPQLRLRALHRWYSRHGAAPLQATRADQNPDEVNPNSIYGKPRTAPRSRNCRILRPTEHGRSAATVCSPFAGLH